MKRDGKYGFADESGAIISDAVWDDAGSASDGLIAVAQGKRWGYIDYTGSVYITPQYQVAAAFSDDIAMYSRDNTGASHQ